MQTLSVTKTIWINASREKVWSTITEAKQLNLWYATYYQWDIATLEVGATVRFYNKNGNTDDLQLAIVEVVDPPNQFTLRWQASTDYPDTQLVTTFLLREENGGTTLELIESGYESYPDEERQQWANATSEGYAMSIEKLKAHVEGRTSPF